MAKIDTSKLIGIKKSRLTVLAVGHGIEGKSTKRKFLFCICECGKDVKITPSNFIKAIKMSCGCERLERTSKQNLLDGRRKRPEYVVWAQIVQRCFNPNHKYFKDYGGRGITMCKEWREDFAVFFKDMGERPKGLTIERINNNGNYEATNCKWATMTEQNNNKRNNK